MTSHDVRRLKTCCLCQNLGINLPANPGIEFPLVICIHSDAVVRKQRKYVHPLCYVREMGTDKLLTLPQKELDSIRLCDVTVGIMRRLLRRAA